MRTRIDGVRRAAYAMPWAIEREKLDAVLDMLDLRAAGVDLAPDERAQLVAERRSVAPRRAGSVAVLPLYDVIVGRANLLEAISGGTSAELFAAAFDEAMADPDVTAIVLDVDSPGGSVYQVPELARKIFAARGAKRVVAVANATAFSAAYYVAAAAGELVVTPSGAVGSVGVYRAHDDLSAAAAMAGVKRTYVQFGEYKTEGNEMEPLSDEAKAYWQQQVDDYGAMFVGDVAVFRGVSEADVLANFGQGRTLLAARALEAGMVDAIETLEEVLSRLAPGHADEGDTPPEPIVPAGVPGVVPAPGDDPQEGGERSARAGRERRAAVAETRSEGERLEGVALRFGARSVEIPGFREPFYEEFEAGAFDASLSEDDIRVLWQHDPSCVLGRVKAGTARVWADTEALRYTATPPDAQWAHDAMESIRRGDVDQNSFAFRVEAGGERWERRDGKVYRTVSAARLFEVGPQTMPAYEDTSVVVVPDETRARFAGFLAAEEVACRAAGRRRELAMLDAEHGPLATGRTRR